MITKCHAGHQRKENLLLLELCYTQKPHYLFHLKDVISEFQEQVELNWFS